MPRVISPASPEVWTENPVGSASAGGCEIAPASSLCPDWEFLGYHGTLWSSIEQPPRRSVPTAHGSARLLTAHKLKEWLPVACVGQAPTFADADVPKNVRTLRPPLVL